MTHVIRLCLSKSANDRKFYESEDHNWYCNTHSADSLWLASVENKVQTQLLRFITTTLWRWDCYQGPYFFSIFLCLSTKSWQILKLAKSGDTLIHSFLNKQSLATGLPCCGTRARILCPHYGHWPLLLCPQGSFTVDHRALLLCS